MRGGNIYQAAVVLILGTLSLSAPASLTLEQQLNQLFVGRSFTIRNFYRGGHLHYGTDMEPTATC
jgi:hypothetical protein